MSQAVATRANRPVAMGTNGVVSSAHQLASMAGLRALMDGGNAFDATVATAATLNVVEPFMSGVGGIGTLLAYIAKEKRIRVLDFSGRAPHRAEPSLFTEESKQEGILSPLVPGNLSGWLTLHEEYGSMDIERLFAPAIQYAEHGFPVTFHNSLQLAGYSPKLASYPTSAAIFLKDGQAPKAGTILKQPQLARSLDLIAKKGQDVFYKGELAKRIAKAVQELGGLITEDDLARYQPQWQEPITISYRGFDVFTAPPNVSGFQMMESLKIMEGFHDMDLICGSARTLHLLMEAVKLAITDRIHFAGDPDFTDVPLSKLLAGQYAATQRQRIDPNKAATVMGERWEKEKLAGSLTPGLHGGRNNGSTTHFSVADRDGNVVTVIQTLGAGFGSGIAIEDTGIFLNNMANWFEIDPECTTPNLIAPWKRVEFCVAPTQVLKDGKFFLSIGTPGGHGILQTTTQMLMYILDFGMNIQQAIEAPRFHYCEGTRVEMEERFPIDVRASLQELGHKVDLIEAWSMGVGGAQGIRVNSQQGVLQGGADPRRDGYAVAW